MLQKHVAKAVVVLAQLRGLNIEALNSLDRLADVYPSSLNLAKPENRCRHIVRGRYLCQKEIQSLH